MTKPDEEFMIRLQAMFKVEAEEHLQAMSATLLELEKSASPMLQATAVEGVFRAAHSLKGAARAVDSSEVESICQAIEGVFASWKREATIPSPEALDALHRALDMIHGLLDSSDQGSSHGGPRSRDELIRRLGQLELRTPASHRPDNLTLVPTSPSPAPEMSSPGRPPGDPPADLEKTVVSQTVRVEVDKLDSGLLRAEDMLVVKSMVAQRATELRELNGRFDRWRREWAKVSEDALGFRQAMKLQAGGLARGPSFGADAVVSFLDWNAEYVRSFETKLLSIAAQADLDRHSVGKRVDDLLENSKKLLMLPFSTLSGIFPKVVRDLCRDQGKEAELVVKGGEVEIEKRVLEEMKDALIHILRNCLDHGIETPAERVRLNKPSRATITIAVLAASGNKAEILVSDDGAGVDVERVKDSAVRLGIIPPTDALTMGNVEAMDLIFRSEVSTSPVVNAISGRGLGMAIVRAQTEKLGGRVSIESTPRVGTWLRMVLPLTLSTCRGVLVAVGDRIFVIPTVNVERVLRVKPQDIQTVENRQVISLLGRAVSLVRLGTLLGLPVTPAGSSDSALLHIVVLHCAEQRIAFVVDQVLREEEVLVKPLRRPLVRVRNIAGVTILGTGKTVPVLNATDLMQSARVQGAAPAATAAETTLKQPPTKRALVAVQRLVVGA